MKVFWRLLLSLASITAILGVLVTFFILWSYITYGDFRSGWFRLGGYQLIAEQYQIDLGNIPTGESRTGTFRLKNLTNEPITLLGVEVDCSCLTTLELPVVVPAKETVDFEVMFSADSIVSEGKVVRQMILNVSVDQPIQMLAVRVTVIPNKKEKQHDP